MGKIVAGSGRIIFAQDERAIYTSLKEMDGEDPVLSQFRQSGGRIVKLPKSYLGDLSHGMFQGHEDIFEPSDFEMSSVDPVKDLV
tara:strand:- start:8266 stop:8520 length:255 start_codon:yes stop_codon:yes gene_type:complete